VAELRKKAQRWDWFMEWFQGFQDGMEEIPYQAEDRSKGSSVYNWHMHFKFELKRLLEQMDQREKEQTPS